MNEKALPSRHRIRNSSPGVLMPSTLPLGHGGSAQAQALTTTPGLPLRPKLISAHNPILFYYRKML